MKIKSFEKIYKLNGASIDEISDEMGAFLSSLKMEKANILRARLSIEEALLRWKDHFGEDREIRVEFGSSLRRPFIRVSIEGEYFNPLKTDDSDASGEYWDWANTLIKSMDQAPSFVRGENLNVIVLKLPRPKQDPAEVLIKAILIGLLIGFVTKALLPVSWQQAVTSTVLDPVKDTYFRILNMVAIPIIFVSVLFAVCGAGNVAIRGKKNRKMIMRFILNTSFICCCVAIFEILALKIPVDIDNLGGIGPDRVAEMLSMIVPPDIITPFQEGQSPQLIFIAIILGNALMILGSKVNVLVGIVNEAREVLYLIADWVTRLTPTFVVILLVMGVWNKELYVLLKVWKPLAVFAVSGIVMILVSMLFVSITKRVNIVKLVKKMRKSFWIAFRNASVYTAYGENVRCCEKLGISGSLTGYALPVGLVLFMPAATMGIVAFSLFAAMEYGVPITLGWVIMMLLLAVALETASPPVTGVDLLAYAAIFSRMGVPEEALIVAMVADVIYTFMSSATDQAMLQMSLVNEAGRMGQLNLDTLRK